VPAEPRSLPTLLGRLPEPLGSRLGAIRAAARALRIETWWVGGGVRDLLRGEPSADIDLVAEGAGRAERLAAGIVAALGGRLRRHDRFLTATVELDDGAAVDVAAARSERYEAPGALPLVEPAGLDVDLRRRDFTINALALRIEPLPHELRDPVGGRADLAAGRLRVLHGGSFRDDPTRILRGMRFERRFALHFEAATEDQAREALRGGALSGLSGDRLRSELALLCDEPGSVGWVFARGAELGLWSALDPDLDGASPGAERIAEWIETAAALDWPPREPGAPSAWRLVLLLLAERLARTARRRLAARLALAAAERELVVAGPDRVARAAALLARESEPPAHAVARVLAPCGAEELAATAALGGAARRWVERDLTELRPLRLRVRGADLVAAGLPPGPGIRRALERTREARLDGRIAAGDELRFALRSFEAAER
jgi:tRNA nucleotidyltransferase (CCA-adding enzyme)